MTLIEQAKQYVNGVDTLMEWTITGRVVTPPMAQDRADTCLRCPRHKPTNFFKSLFAGAVKRQVGLKNKLKLRVKGEKQLGECEVCGCVMKTKIWMELDTIKPTDEESKDYWHQCWLLK
jgi:hypothetical protein